MKKYPLISVCAPKKQYAPHNSAGFSLYVTVSDSAFAVSQSSCWSMAQ